ncbi:hypothetical protein RND81_06G046800 [Saponaria officinalis]|uniref:YDG domain-containing protein n=1 Tax=Saponaria officinalis TaxID=3572 RepID=A0AAW1K3V3_SAPOF
MSELKHISSIFGNNSAMASPNLDSNFPENYPWWRKVSASKSKPSFNEKIKKNPHPKTSNSMDNNGDIEKIKEKLGLFRAKCQELCRISLEERMTCRIDFLALKELRKQGIIAKMSEPVLGSIPGVEIGDSFNYRVELMIAGLHSRNQHGIDYMKKGRKLMATCIVATEGYPDKIGGHDEEGEVLIYTGEGGMYGLKKGECPKDQKMVKGNLALKSSISVDNDVRVVRGFRCGDNLGGMNPKFTYVYDGLYKVVGCIDTRDIKSTLIFKFELRRNPRQPVVAWRTYRII